MVLAGILRTALENGPHHFVVEWIRELFEGHEDTAAAQEGKHQWAGIHAGSFEDGPKGSEKKSTIFVFPFVSRDGIRFAIYRKRWYKKTGELFAKGQWRGNNFKSVELDRYYGFTSNDKVKGKALFDNDLIRDYIQALPPLYMCIPDDDDVFSLGKSYPDKVDVLYVKVFGDIMADEAKIQTTRRLIALTLESLRGMGSVALEDTNVTL